MSLVRTLLSGVNESVNLEGYEYTGHSSMESYFLDSACESLFSEIYNIDKAYHVADVIGEAQVIREGADAEAILEGIVSSGIDKLKAAFKKFLAKIKEWFAKVKKFFKSLVLKGKDFVKEFGDELRKKNTTGFKYKGFSYSIDDGDAIVDTVSSKVDHDIREFAGTTFAKIADGTITSTADHIEATAKLLKVDVSKSATEYQDSKIKEYCGETSISDMQEQITEAYRGGDTEKGTIEDFEAPGNDVRTMLTCIENFDKYTKLLNKEESLFEKNVNELIKGLDKVGNKSVDTTNTNNAQTTDATKYKNASKISSYCTALLNIRKAAVSTRTSMYKEMNGAFTSVLRAFYRFKPTQDSMNVLESYSGRAAYAGALEIISEASDTELPDVEIEEDVEERYAYGTSSNAGSLLETAMQFL